MAANKLYVATETVLTADGEPDITRDVTFVTGDSDTYKRFTQYFREVEPHHRGVEQATAAPGEERQVALPTADEPEPKKSGK